MNGCIYIALNRKFVPFFNSEMQPSLNNGHWFRFNWSNSVSLIDRQTTVERKISIFRNICFLLVWYSFEHVSPRQRKTTRVDLHATRIPTTWMECSIPSTTFSRSRTLRLSLIRHKTTSTIKSSSLLKTGETNWNVSCSQRTKQRR